MLKPYTVLLLYPDYLSANYGQETNLAHVKAKNPEEAVKIAQTQLACIFEHKESPENFYPLLTIEGFHNDLTRR